jgi:hypothetical protein
MDPWKRHLRQLLVSFAILVATGVMLVWIANPYGNLLGSPLPHVLMDDNQRFQYPAVIRSGRYDSLVIGTSTARLLQPKQLEGTFGGRFANLALNSGTAWEQMRLVRLFREEVKRRRTLIVALDHVWCAADADTQRITKRGFPEWMFDHNPWNDIPNMLNARTIEIAGRRIGHALGLVKARWPHNGYEVFVSPERDYDLKRARQHIWGPTGPKPDDTATAAVQEKQQALAPETAHSFPALAWLNEIVDAGQGWQRVVLLITPVHRAALPAAGTPEGAREAACKAVMTAIARRNGVALVDFRLPSPITRRDENYWDSLHYRVPIAGRIIDGLTAALATDRDDPGGDFRVLYAPPRM